MIELLNRRFVSFYYNTGGPGLGKDAAAAAFTKGKTKNVFAFYAAFDADGTPLGVTDVYAGKENVFDFLVALLRENPEFDHYTKEEKATLDRAKVEPDSAKVLLAAGKLLEELGRYKEARPHYQRVMEKKATPDQRADAYRALMRMARYRRDWKEMDRIVSQIEARKPDDRKALKIEADLAAEQGHQLLAEKKYAEARKRMEAAIRDHPDSTRRSELHFAAGVACFFLKERDWASYHWCWVVENLPDDRLARRCYTAAAHEGMPYENPELGDYAAKLPGGSIPVIQRAYQRAKATYEKLKDR